MYFSGMDMEPGREGGTWLGLSKTGKFSVVLNILSEVMPNMKGRGKFTLLSNAHLFSKNVLVKS